MCGIAGIINHQNRYNEKELLCGMTGAVAHRGPDGWGSCSFPGVELGHRRLAVIDLESGRQPLFNEDGSIALVINGEIYNYLALRKDLEAHGHRFSSNSDSEVLIHLYEEKGPRSIAMLDGMFAFALYDSRKNTALLGRDPMGKKPLLYFIHDRALIFGSEFAALKQHPAFPDTLDYGALAEYFSFQYVPGEKSIYKNVFKLPPGHFMEYNVPDGEQRITPYFRLDFSNKLDGDEETLGAMLREKVERAVAKRLMSDVPFGVFLSGGIDSTVISGITARLLDGKPCDAFTVGFSESRYDERAAARIGAAAVNAYAGGNLHHHEREVVIDDFSLLEELTDHCGEPYADASILPTAYLSAFAKEKITVAISGDGADEMFGGYERYLAMKMAAMTDILPPGLRRWAAGAVQLLPDRGERSFSGRLRRWTQLAAGSKDRYFSLLDRCPAPVAGCLFTGDFQRMTADCAVGVFRSLERSLTAADPVERLSELDIISYLPGDILVKVDISSMASALEVRSPFLDREVAEFAAALPWRYKLNGRQRKYLLRRAFRDIIPPELFNAPKKGFGVPVASLLRSTWMKNAGEVLFDGPLKEQPFIDMAGLYKLWEEHQAGKRDRSCILWSSLVLALFLKRQRSL